MLIIFKDPPNHNLQVCNCRLCCGKLRDRRTVRKHFLHHPYHNTPGNEPNQCSSVREDIVSSVHGPDETYNGVNSGKDSDDRYGNDGAGTSNGGGNGLGLGENSSNNSGNDNGSSSMDDSEEEGNATNGNHSSGNNNGGNGGTDGTDDNGSDDNGSDDCSNDDGEDVGNDGGNNGGNDGDEDDNSDDGSNSVFSEDEMEEEMEKCILRVLESKVKYGWSQEEALAQLRSLYEFTQDNNIPHRTWSMVMKFLKKLGYKNPRHYKICCGNDHVTLVRGNQCPNCDKSKNECTDYFVLGLNLESVFSSASKFTDHMAHWEEREDWFNINDITVPYKEVWHGSRFRDLSFFWDEEVESCLPTRCPNCSNIISTDELSEANGRDRIEPGDRIHLSCNECTFDFVHNVESVKGNQLNQAFIFHEDGFNAFTKKSRGIAAIHISNACTRKELRLHGKNLRVYSFIPTHLLNEGVPHRMDAFLRPLIDEITELFLNGIQVNIPETVELSNFSVQQGIYTVRALLLLGTADLKAHQEIILYAGGMIIRKLC